MTQTEKDICKKLIEYLANIIADDSSYRISGHSRKNYLLTEDSIKTSIELIVIEDYGVKKKDN